MTDTTTTYTPERCRELVEHFREECADFVRKLDNFPGLFASALDNDPDRTFWAGVALGISDSLIGPCAIDAYTAELRRMQDGKVPYAGLFAQLTKHERATREDRLFDMARVLRDVKEATPEGVDEEIYTTARMIPLKRFPWWYQRQCGADEPPVPEHQLRRWASRPDLFHVDWIVRKGRAVFVDVENFLEWMRTSHPESELGGSHAA